MNFMKAFVYRNRKNSNFNFNSPFLFPLEPPNLQCTYMKWGKGTLETIGKVLKGWIGRGRRGILGAEEEKIKGGSRCI